MNIAGLQKLTLLDYPGKTACTVFTPGCNFRCPFCHNALLVTHSPEELISEEEFFSFLSKRQGILDGICITGGEPTLQKDLIAFMEKIKAMGFLVKLDTNGAKPDILKEIIAKGLADYVAMDIKASPARYGEAVGIKDFDFSPVKESICILEESGIDHEFRTTVTDELHTEENFPAILSLFSENTPYFLQQFKDSGNLIDKSCHGWETQRMKNLRDTLALQHCNVSLREG
ncbi:MAG: anaerobic ribonucleoside-triphosphate reductase activating protein [Ruminococcaceae bacterium]|nr:anaerobic ribonucleoside-triphosphate reductase activating protein [Oscillospiraceae bacterium]